MVKWIPQEEVLPHTGSRIALHRHGDVFPMKRIAQQFSFVGKNHFSTTVQKRLGNQID